MRLSRETALCSGKKRVDKYDTLINANVMDVLRSAIEGKPRDRVGSFQTKQLTERPS